jgi:predicted ferric reductase
MDLVDLSAYAGLGAVGFATLNLLIGLLMATRYSPVKYWPHRRINLFYLHRLTAYVTIGLTVVHPLILLWVKRVHFRVLDLLFPVWSPLQPFQNSLGAIALYVLLIVVATSIYRLNIGRKWWKLFHWLVYPAAVLLFVHGVFTDSELKTGHADVWDGEKVYVELCFLLIVVVSIVSMQIRRKRVAASAQQEVYQR